MKKAIVLVADGSEEMEAVIAIDCLRRAEVDVTVAGLTGGSPVTCSRNVRLVPDAALKDVPHAETYDALILPGGMGGAVAFSESPAVHQLLKTFLNNESKTLGIICAAPLALEKAHLAKHRKITSHPSIRDQLKAAGYDHYSEDRVCIDGNLITSRGPGTAFEFSLAIIERLKGAHAAEKVALPMVL
ncbi:Protein deglycase DJ-1zDJ-1 [Dinochytrium kinnereticum]|nr:Protein deglycase DJ-1zDJ-1 [Dinochytrium kinnereticum]